MYLGLREIPTECRSHSFHCLANVSHKTERDDWEQQESDGHADFDRSVAYQRSKKQALKASSCL